MPLFNFQNLNLIKSSGFSSETLINEGTDKTSRHIFLNIYKYKSSIAKYLLYARLKKSGAVFSIFVSAASKKAAII